jgi:Family of unknown function (DUF6585)
MDTAGPSSAVVGTRLAYTIVLADGQKGHFGGCRPTLAPLTPLQSKPGTTWKVNIRQFAGVLQYRVTNAQLPKAIDALNAGQAISFGPLTVNSAGVTKHNLLLEWSKIRSAWVGQTYVAVMRGSFLPLPTFVT